MRNLRRFVCIIEDCCVCPDAWRSQSAIDGFRNGDANSSSLAAKGFRSVRPNLQDKKTLSQVKEVPLLSSPRFTFQVFSYFSFLHLLIGKGGASLLLSAILFSSQVISSCFSSFLLSHFWLILHPLIG